MNQTCMETTLQLDLNELVIGKGITIPMRMKRIGDFIFILVKLPLKFVLCCNRVSNIGNSILDQLTDAEREEYLKKRYTVKGLVEGLQKIGYKAASPSYVHKAMNAGFKIPENGITVYEFHEWVKNTKFKSTPK